MPTTNPRTGMLWERDCARTSRHFWAAYVFTELWAGFTRVGRNQEQEIVQEIHLELMLRLFLSFIVHSRFLRRKT